MTFYKRVCINMAVFVIMASLCLPSFAKALEIEIKGEVFSLDADETPLKEILRKMVEMGIKVYADPELNPRITASFKDRDLQQGLGLILKNIDYALVWEKEGLTETGAKSFRLSEIKIFRPGSPAKVEPLAVNAVSEEEEKKTPLETKVIIQGNKVFVPVTLGYGENQVKTSLVFDTGASIMLLHQEVADELGIYGGEELVGQGAGGISIKGIEAVLDYVVLGPHRKEKMRTGVVAYDGFPIKHYHGLLGMNFIKGLDYKIDFDRSVIIWKTE